VQARVTVMLDVAVPILSLARDGDPMRYVTEQVRAAFEGGKFWPHLILLLPPQVTVEIVTDKV
jgi:hypothetical protein